MQKFTENEIIEMAKQNNNDAFELLYNNYKDLMAFHLLKYFSDENVVNDLLQEVFLKMWTKISQFDNRSKDSFKSWLYKITTNIALNHLRSIKRKKETPLFIQDDEKAKRLHPEVYQIKDRSEDKTLEYTEKIDSIHTIIEALPAQKREVINLVYQNDYTIAETSRELNIPKGTVKSRLHYGLKDISKKIK